MHRTKRNTYNARKDLFESLGCTGCFGFTPIEAVFEFEEWLADRVGERDAGRVDKGNGADTPALRDEQRKWNVESGYEREACHERTGDIAPESARAEEQTSGRGDLFEVERGEDAPAHELEVQIDSLACEPVVCE